MFDPTEKSIEQLQSAMEEGLVTSLELVRFYEDRIRRLDGELRAVEELSGTAEKEAEALDAERKAGKKRSPLHGIPIIIKENYDVLGMSTTASCSALRGCVPRTESCVVRRLREAGAVILWKTTMSELARHGYTAGSAFGQACNPYDLSRTPGGSSGGTGIGIALNFAAAGPGTDPVNSVRSPSSACSIVGIRPTLGLWSRSGIVPCTDIQDSGGPMARTVADAALLLELGAGYDDADSVTAGQLGHVPASYLDFLKEDGLRGKRIGLLLTDYGTDPDILRVMDRAAEVMRSCGAVLTEIRDEALRSDDVNASCDVQRYETRSSLQRYFDGHPEAPVRGLDDIVEKRLAGPTVKADLEACAAEKDPLRSEAYHRKLESIAALRNRLLRVFSENGLDALCFPHQQVLVTKIGENSQPGRNGGLTSMSGMPSIVVPGGYSSPDADAPIGVPIGIEFISSPWREGTLLEIAYSFERHTQYRKQPLYGNH